MLVNLSIRAYGKSYFASLRILILLQGDNRLTFVRPETLELVILKSVQDKLIKLGMWTGQYGDNEHHFFC